MKNRTYKRYKSPVKKRLLNNPNIKDAAAIGVSIQKARNKYGTGSLSLDDIDDIPGLELLK